MFTKGSKRVFLGVVMAVLIALPIIAAAVVPAVAKPTPPGGSSTHRHSGNTSLTLVGADIPSSLLVTSGATMTLTYTISNSGTVGVSGLKFTGPVANGAANSATLFTCYSGSDPQAVFNLGSNTDSDILPANSSVTCVFKYILDPADLCSSLQFVASVSGMPAFPTTGTDPMFSNTASISLQKTANGTDCNTHRNGQPADTPTPSPTLSPTPSQTVAPMDGLVRVETGGTLSHGTFGAAAACMVGIICGGIYLLRKQLPAGCCSPVR